MIKIVIDKANNDIKRNNTLIYLLTFNIFYRMISVIPFIGNNFFSIKALLVIGPTGVFYAITTRLASFGLVAVRGLLGFG